MTEPRDPYDGRCRIRTPIGGGSAPCGKLLPCPVHSERAPGRHNRCQVVVPSGLDAPRTWRCWYPLPCPHHPYKIEARVAATMRVPRSILDPC